MRRLVAALSLLCSIAHAQVTGQRWGTTRDGRLVWLYTLRDGAFVVRVTNFGARIVSIAAPDRAGHADDVVLGYDSFAPYENDRMYFGATIGRYANRIADGTFTLDGKNYELSRNEGANTLHGGGEGFSQRLWTTRQRSDSVEMHLVSPDGDMGFPGEVRVSVTFRVKANSLTIRYRATTTKPTIVSLTNHSYFALGGGTVLHDEIRIAADRFLPVRNGQIPTGQIRSVSETPFDFRQPRSIIDRIHAKDEQLRISKGYGHYFLLDRPQSGRLSVAAEVWDPQSGRTLRVSTTESGVQFYSGNFLDGSVIGKGGARYERYSAFCLETQRFPDAPHHPEFPSSVLRVNEVFHSETIYTFGAR